jgi:hypothetical protein
MGNGYSPPAPTLNEIIQKSIKLRNSLPYAFFFLFDTPRGIRIPVASVKGRCPRPLDDGGLDSFRLTFIILSKLSGFVNYFFLNYFMPLRHWAKRCWAWGSRELNKKRPPDCFGG